MLIQCRVAGSGHNAIAAHAPVLETVETNPILPQSLALSASIMSANAANIVKGVDTDQWPAWALQSEF
jgi:hypothetical protein